MTALMKAVKNNDAAAVKKMIQAGVDVNELENGDAPLVMAAYQGRDEIVKMLLEAGADVTAVDPGMKATALHAAAYAGRTTAARLLIAHGIDIDKQGPHNGYTALHDAIWQSHIETARVIIEAGANLSLKSNQGQTPLEFARSKKLAALVDLMERKRAGG
jgi:ankyrin repeat protein